MSGSVFRLETQVHSQSLTEDSARYLPSCPILSMSTPTTQVSTINRVETKGVGLSLAANEEFALAVSLPAPLNAGHLTSLSRLPVPRVRISRVRTHPGAGMMELLD